jgi:hypothetical protein
MIREELEKLDVIVIMPLALLKRPAGGSGGRGGRRPPRAEGATTDAPKTETPAQQQA